MGIVKKSRVGLVDRVSNRVCSSGGFPLRSGTVTCDASGEQTNIVTGRTFGYDPIGNRVSSFEDAGAQRLTTFYEANELNQYTSIQNAPAVPLRGDANRHAVVTVNGDRTERDGGSANFTPWSYALPSDSSDAAFQHVDILAVAQGATGEDVEQRTTGSVFAPAAETLLEYDDDGNMTFDGHFRYSWNGENRMIRAEEAGRNVFDLLSDHLPFLGDSAGKSILGIAVASEMYTHPFASENFASGLARCPTFIRRPSAEKPHVAGLFHLARFVRGLDGSAKLDALRFMEDRAFPSSDQEPKKFPMSEAEQTGSPSKRNRVQSKP